MRINSANFRLSRWAGSALWSVHNQPDMSPNSLLKDLDLHLGTAKRSTVQQAIRFADCNGTLQAVDMRRLTSDPRQHTSTSLRDALIALGCKET